MELATCLLGVSDLEKDFVSVLFVLYDDFLLFNVYDLFFIEYL